MGRGTKGRRARRHVLPTLVAAAALLLVAAPSALADAGSEYLVTPSPASWFTVVDTPADDPALVPVAPVTAAVPGPDATDVPPVTATAPLAARLAKLPASLTIQHVLTRGLPQSVTCSQACTVVVRLEVPHAAAVALGLVPRHGRGAAPVLVGQGSAATTTAGTVLANVRLGAKVRAALADERAVQLRQTITITSDGATATKVRTITLAAGRH